MAEFEKSLQSICDNMVRTASYAIGYLDIDKRQKALDTLRENLESYIKSAESIKNINSLMSATVDNLEGNDQSRLIEEFNQQTNNFTPDVSNNEFLKQYDERIKELIKNIAGVQVDSGDAEIEIQDEGGMRSNANLICPITKSKMTEPMKNLICGHIYDKSGVMAMIESNSMAKCPIVGCSNQKFLNLSDIKPDLVKQICIEMYSD